MAELLEHQHRKLAESMGDESVSEAPVPDRPVMRFSLDGPPVTGHEVEAGVLGKWLVALQNVVTSVAYSLDDMRMRHDVGPIPKDIQESTKLLAGATFPSSYGMTLEAGRTGHQETIPGTGSENLLDRAVQCIFDLTDQAEGGQDDEMLDTALPLGRRAITHLSELSGVLASADASITLSWQWGEAVQRVSRLTTASAARWREILKAAEVEDSIEQITGTFTGSTRTRGFIEIETPHGVVVVHVAKDEATDLSARYVHRRVLVEVRVLSARLPGGSERRTYRLLDISEAPTTG